VKAIIKYEAVDGALFATEQECIKYERFLDEAAKCAAYIKKSESGNDSVGLQNTEKNVELFNAAFRKLLEEYAPSLVEKWDECKKGIIGRYLSDGSDVYYRRLDRLYYAGVLCVGDDNKSYGQPYYANLHKSKP